MFKEVLLYHVNKSSSYKISKAIRSKRSIRGSINLPRRVQEIILFKELALWVQSKLAILKNPGESTL
ncbi:hypothetical protein BsWGS_03611 [Bradybaena similaris]